MSTPLDPIPLLSSRKSLRSGSARGQNRDEVGIEVDPDDGGHTVNTRPRILALGAACAVVLGGGIAAPGHADDAVPPAYRLLQLKGPSLPGGVILQVKGVTESGTVLAVARSNQGPTTHQLMVWDAQGRVLYRGEPLRDGTTADGFAVPAIGNAVIGDTGVVAAILQGRLHRWSAAGGLVPLTHPGVLDAYSTMLDVNDSGQIIAGTNLWAAGATAPVAFGANGPHGQLVDLDDAGRVAFIDSQPRRVGIWDPVGGAKEYRTDDYPTSAVLDGAGSVVAVLQSTSSPDEPWNESRTSRVVTFGATSRTWVNPEPGGFRDGSDYVLRARNGRFVVQRGDAYKVWQVIDSTTTRVLWGSDADVVHLDAAGRVTLASSPKGTIMSPGGTTHESIPMLVADAADSGWVAGRGEGRPYGEAALGVRTDVVRATSTPALDVTLPDPAPADDKAPELRVGGGEASLLRVPVKPQPGRTAISAILRLHVTAVSPGGGPLGYEVRLVDGGWSATKPPKPGRLLATVAAGAPGGDLAIDIDPADLTPGIANIVLVPRGSSASSASFASAQAPVVAQRPRLTVTWW